MTVKYKPLNLILMFATCWYMNYKLQEVGVPDGVIIFLSIAWAFLFPLRFMTVEEEKIDK